MEKNPSEMAAAELAAVLESMIAGAGLQASQGPTLEQLADSHPALAKQLEKLSPIGVAVTFGALLTVPALQANCLRLEVLVHLALMLGNGSGKPSDAFVKSAFRELGTGFCGNMEDPAEDLLVRLIRSPRGNFRVLEGIWEGNAFYLQRFVNVVEAMPEGSGYDDLRDDIYALLALSDLVCERARWERYQLGNEMPLDRLSGSQLGSIGSKTRRIRFPIADLEQIGLNPLNLAPFIFQPRARALLNNSHIGNSPLERYPLIRDTDSLYLVLPTAVGVAIRYHVIRRMNDAGMLEAFKKGIANEYAHLLNDTQLLGGRRRAPVEFHWTDRGAFAGVTSAIDKGRYLNLIFMTDELINLDETGFAGLNPDSARADEVFEEYIDYAYRAASSRPDFIDGISLVIGCGVGRGSAGMLPGNRPNWRVDGISAYDLETLSWLPGFNPLSLWRLLDASSCVETMGTTLQNVNGLLNLVAWSRSLDGHIVPHGQLPDNAEEDHALLLMVTQNGLRKLRHEVAVLHDPCVMQDMEENWIPVRRDQQSDFDDDSSAPLYASETPNSEGWLMSAYQAANRTWWAEASFPERTPSAVAYERWRVVTTWLSRAAPMLDNLAGLPREAICWRAVFEQPLSDRQVEPTQRSYEEARRQVSVFVDHEKRTVVTHCSEEFEHAFYHPENIAEKALLDALLEGVLSLADMPGADRNPLLSEIIPSPQARHGHAFAVRTYRDHVYAQLNRNSVVIDRDDEAYVRLGLGWTIRPKVLGGTISGKDEAIGYLNSLVTQIEVSLISDLREYNREALISSLLLNYETAAFDRDRWRRTSSALVALHGQGGNTLETIRNHEFKLNGVFQATRTLIEIAICEAPLDGGRAPGKLDLSRLMAKTALLFHIGGWSDAIRWDVMEPTIRITPLGDVHAKFDFVDEIITPHARESSDVRIRDAIESYADNLKQPEGMPNTSHLVASEFLDAWEEEFGASFQDVRVFVDWLEDRGIKANQPLMRMKKADFEGVIVGEQRVANDKTAAILEMLTLKSRASWRIVPEGFEDRDRQPWRFRRRLSAIRRPIFQSGASEELLVVPGLIRESFAYIVANYMRGDFPAYQLKPKMRSWAAKEADKRGAEFTKSVSEKLEELGWKTETEVRVTKILGRSLDRNYGDVDVLAWNAEQDRILLIECKDVQYRKTYGEICEQLTDFRGELRNNGKPDYLLRHLLRVELLRTNQPTLAAYVKMAAPGVKVESHLIFKNPVPMRYALERLSAKVRTSILTDVPEIAAQK